jgi:hypothetical protein
MSRTRITSNPEVGIAYQPCVILRKEGHLSQPYTYGKMLDLGKEWEILQELLPTQVIADFADAISCLDSVPIHRPNPSLTAKRLLSGPDRVVLPWHPIARHL